MTETTHREFDFLREAGSVLVVLQLAIFAKMWIDLGLDRASDNFPIFILCTGVFVASQRRLAAHPPNRGAARWILAMHATALALLALGTLAIGFKRLVPDTPLPSLLIIRALFALMWAVVALKGAAMGKLKPGSGMGLCVSWTRQSRLAWDKGHRTLGRVLFWGGLIGLATSLVIAPPISAAMWFATVALALTAALFESWRTWRLDPDRAG